MFNWLFRLITKIKVWRWERQNRWRYCTQELHRYRRNDTGE